MKSTKKEKAEWRRMIFNGKETNYLINTDGKIKALDYNREGKVKVISQFNHKGYRCVSITVNHKQYHALVHRLVAETFLENGDNLPVVNHKNGKKYDNNIENLEWCTQKENMEHASAHNLLGKHYGSYHGNAKLTEKDVHKICKLLVKNKKTVPEIADMFSISPFVVYNIKNGSSWKHVSKDYDLTKHTLRGNTKGQHSTKKTRLSRKVVREICEDLMHTDLDMSDIAKKYNTTRSKVEQIRYGNAWKDISCEYDFSNRIVYDRSNSKDSLRKEK